MFVLFVVGVVVGVCCCVRCVLSFVDVVCCVSLCVFCFVVYGSVCVVLAC